MIVGAELHARAEAEAAIELAEAARGAALVEALTSLSTRAGTLGRGAHERRGACRPRTRGTGLPPRARGRGGDRRAGRRGAAGERARRGRRRRGRGHARRVASGRRSAARGEPRVRMAAAVPPRPPDLLTVRAVLRTVLVVVAVVLTLLLIYILRKPLTWIFIAGFIAIALSGPITFLERWMKRGLAIAIVYLALILTPFALIGLLVPPIVTQANNLVQQPAGVRAGGHRLRQQQRPAAQAAEGLRPHRQARGAGAEAPEQARRRRRRAQRHRPRASSTRSSPRVTILVLSLFMVGSGRRFLDAWARAVRARARGVDAQPVRRASATAIGNYVAGALLQATIAGVTSWIMLLILGVPYALPLAVIVFLLDLVPLVGATLGAILVGIVTVFSRLPARHDHLGDLRDRLPAGREQRHPAAHPVAARCSSSR